MSSAERSARHGELKQLRKLKRAHESENTRRPKLLKTDDRMEAEFHDVEEEDTSTDIRDIEFRLRNDPAQVRVRFIHFIVEYFSSATILINLMRNSFLIICRIYWKVQPPPRTKI